MTGSGFLPVSYVDNKLMFLFGLESVCESSAKGWSDFAGGMEKNENENSDKDIYHSALREFAEETTGFLGGPREIDELVKRNGGYVKYSYDNRESMYLFISLNLIINFLYIQYNLFSDYTLLCRGRYFSIMELNNNVESLHIYYLI